MVSLISVERLLLGAAMVLVVIGVAGVWGAGASAKRLASIVIAGLGALLGLAAIGAPEGALLVGAAALFAHLLIGVALLVRLQEAYGGVDAAQFDAGDEQSEPPESGA